MNGSAYKYFLGMLLAVGLGLGAYVVYGSYSKRGKENKPQQPVAQLNTPVGDFTLTDRFGKEFHAKDLLGEVWVASFFFTECPTVCVQLNGTIADLIEQDFADDPVKFVSISVDPKKDDLEVLHRYAATTYVEARGIDPERWIFLTEPDGKIYKIEEIAKDNFKVSSGKITHSDRLIIVDRKGVIRAAISSGWDYEVERFKGVLREVLDEEAGEQPSADGETDSSAG